MTFKEKIKLHPLIVSFVGIILGVAINYLFSLLATSTGVWLYLDNIGTALVAATCGPLPGIIVGIINNCLNSINDSVSIFYCVISALAAVNIWFFVRRGYLRKWYNCFLLLLILVFICGFCGSILTWFLYGGGIGEGISSTMANYFYAQNGNAFWSQMAADVIIDIWDKAIVVAILYLFITFVPSSFTSCLPLGQYLDKDFSFKEEKKNRIKTRKSTIRFKFIFGFLVLSLVMIGTIAITTYSIVSSNTTKTYQGIGIAGSRAAATIVDGDLVDSFLNGENEVEYKEEKTTLEAYFSTNEKIEYLYVYKIESDHLVVVFDLDTPTVQGEEKGSFIDWDPAFEQYKTQLLNGEEIPTIIVNDVYGYLLSSYTPIKNSQGVTVAYGCVDISMETVSADLRTATTKTTSILLVISILFISLAFELTERIVLKPIEKITSQVQTFQNVGISKWLDSDEKRIYKWFLLVMNSKHWMLI